MFQFGVLVLCLVFTVGYIFFTAAGEREEKPMEDLGSVLANNYNDADAA